MKLVLKFNVLACVAGEKRGPSRSDGIGEGPRFAVLPHLSHFAKRKAGPFLLPFHGRRLIGL